MFVRVAHDPGPDFQQRVHQYDMELPDDDLPDASVICKVQTPISRVLGIGVWDGENWRTIHGQLPA